MAADTHTASPNAALLPATPADAPAANQRFFATATIVKAVRAITELNYDIILCRPELTYRTPTAATGNRVLANVRGIRRKRPRRAPRVASSPTSRPSGPPRRRRLSTASDGAFATHGAAPYH